jgi:hypothetical protein
MEFNLNNFKFKLEETSESIWLYIYDKFEDKLLKKICFNKQELLECK